MHSSVGLDLTVVGLVAAAVLCIAVLVVILVGPSRRVRNEPPLDPVAENRLLLGHDPEHTTGEMPALPAYEDLPDREDRAG